MLLHSWFHMNPRRVGDGGAGVGATVGKIFATMLLHLWFHDHVLKKMNLHIKLKGITNAATWKQIFYQQILIPPPPTIGVGVKRSKFNFLRTWSCCISNYMESRMQQHGSKYFARRPPNWPWGWGQKIKIQLFQNMVMLHIKLKRTINATTW